MCGIVALWGSRDETLVRAMLARMRHRGPDGEGVHAVGDGVLGHVRLAIIDVAGGAQPMTNETGDLAIAFNGEIYNHLVLRDEVQARHVFKTRSDTEVLLHLYEEDGEDILRRLDGMFALALAGPHGLLLARDPLGIKPLYYGWLGDTFIAGSELTAFPPMDHVEMLPAGHAMYARGEPWRFADPYPPPHPVRRPSLTETLQEIRLRLERACVKRLMSDVPVGVFLSGGLDSSLIAAIMRPHTLDLHSFTAGMQGAPDLEAAREVADFLGTEHHELIYTEDDVENALHDVIRALESYDAPLVRSAIPMYFVSQLASKYAKVVLMGEGADELFAGYSYLKNIGGGQALKDELHAITERLQDTNLQRGDRITMAHSLEGRVPFLDTSLVRYLARIPAEYLDASGARPEKWLLREACKGLLPARILSRKKMKFSEGAGSAETMAERVREWAVHDEWDPDREVEPGLKLRSPEELHYWRIWKEVMPWDLPASVVGRTRDRTAAAQ